MSTKKKHVVFDIVGTCVSFDAYYDCIDQVLGDRLRQHCITPKHFGFTWQTLAELEFTFLSISERHKPYQFVLRSMFYRSLWFAGITDPRSFATEEECERCVQGYSSLQLRPGGFESFQILRDAGFTVWCFTTGDIQRVRGYFERAGVHMPLENFISCDSSGVVKPHLDSYRSVLDKFGVDDEKWFAAAHMWDVSAAVKAGFQGAYCTIYEKEPCLEMAGVDMRVIADTLPKMAQGIVEA